MNKFQGVKEEEEEGVFLWSLESFPPETKLQSKTDPGWSGRTPPETGTTGEGTDTFVPTTLVSWTVGRLVVVYLDNNNNNNNRSSHTVWYILKPDTTRCIEPLCVLKSEENRNDEFHRKQDFCTEGLLLPSPYFSGFIPLESNIGVWLGFEKCSTTRSGLKVDDSPS